MGRAYICDGVRTPIGRFGGSLSSIRADDLAAIPIAALMNRNVAVDWEAVDEVVMGCANQAGEDNRNVARMASLLAGLPANVPGSTINRLCASGLDAVIIAARAISSGEADLVVAGGVESMTRSPLVMAKARVPFARDQKIEDTSIGWRFINPKMHALHGTDSMPATAENVATEFNISRGDQDLFAVRSQARAAGAQESGRLAAEIVPVAISLPSRDSIEVVRDEHPRETSLEALTALKPIVRPEGTVTAGNSSGVNDGSAALLVASEAAISRYGLTPRARIVGAAATGVPPRIMGIGPVSAVRKLMDKNGLSIIDVDLIELNEAFAAQALAVTRELGLPDGAPHVNPNGGAIALGHPLGMSGSRLAISASIDLHSHGFQRAVVTMCTGVGQGVALLLGAID